MTWVVVGVAVVGGLVQAESQKNIADAQAFELDRQAEQEKISAEGLELQRRQKLNKVLAANVVGLSTSGISGEGTPASIALGSAQQASISEGLEGLSSRLKQAQLKRQSINATRTGQAQRASTLLTTGVRAAQSIPSNKG
jgi:hypothetical protein